MGGKTQTTTQQATNAPWAPQQPYITQGLQQAQANLGKSTVAPLSPQTKAGLGMIEQTAGSSQIPQQAAQQLSSTLGGNYLSGPQSWMNTIQPPGASAPTARQTAATSRVAARAGNPSGVAGMEYLNPYIKALSASAAHNVMPNVQGGFMSAGRSGASPLANGAIAEGMTAAMAPYLFGSAESQMGRLFSGYQDERNRQMQATSQAPGINQLQYAPGEAMLGAGSVYDQYNQQKADEPWNNLGNFMQIAGQPYGSQTSGVSTAPRTGLFSGDGSALSLGMRGVGK